MTFPMYKNFLPLAFTLLFVIFPSVTFASNYTVSPILIDHELEKRDIIEEKITLTNKGDNIVRIYPTVNEVSVNEGGSVKGFLEPSMVDRSNSVTSWLEISRARIELQPNETKEITLTIKVNPEVGAGEYHAFVGFPEGSNRPEAEKLVYGGQAQGTVVRIGVEKVQNQFLRLEKFSVDRFIKDSAKGEVAYTLQNPGDDPVVPKGEVIFYDNGGIEVSAIEINAASTVVEPGKTVSFIEKVPENMKIGKYKALLSVEYGEHQTASLHDTVFFYVMPLWQLAVVFGTILVFAIVLALFLHRRYDVNDDDEGIAAVPMYIRQSRSESKDHDIDLSKKN